MVRFGSVIRLRDHWEVAGGRRRFPRRSARSGRSSVISPAPYRLAALGGLGLSGGLGWLRLLFVRGFAVRWHGSHGRFPRCSARSGRSSVFSPAPYRLTALGGLGLLGGFVSLGGGCRSFEVSLGGGLGATDGFHMLGSGCAAASSPRRVGPLDGAGGCLKDW